MQSVERIIKIIDCFSIEETQLSLGEITKKTSLPKPSVYRICEALCEEHILNKDPSTLKYRIGIKLFELGSMFLRSLELRKIAFPEMEKLQELTGESIHMGIIEGNEVISIEGIESNKSLHIKLWVGKRSPIYCTSVGKAILAFHTDKEIENIINNIDLKPYTKNTITDKEKLLNELKSIRKNMIAIDYQEHEEGIICIGAPIFENKRVIASISISGPVIRMTDENIKKYGENILEAVNNVTKKLS